MIVPAPMGSINPDWPLADFASGLRALKKTSRLTYRQMAEKTNYSRTVLSAAAGGRELPTLQVTLAYIGVCGGSAAEWECLWAAARIRFHGHKGGERHGRGA
jgi:hypothetical protein